MVEHHLAKVGVVGSNLIARSSLRSAKTPVITTGVFAFLGSLALRGKPSLKMLKNRMIQLWVLLCPP